VPILDKIKLTESGAFIRTIITENGKKHQKTIKQNKNDEKVILGMIGELEVYAFPFSFPDLIFIGKFPICTKIDVSNEKGVLGAYNKIRWFLHNEWRNKPKSSIRTEMRRQHIVSAYNNGLFNQNDKKNASVGYNLIRRENGPELVWKCPFCIAEIWFNSRSELIRHIQTEKKNKEKSHFEKIEKGIESCKIWVVKENGKWRILK
jgi:hypothetical protein